MVAATVSTENKTFKVAQSTRHIDAMRPHPDNPRNEIREDNPKIIELADSIIQEGVIEPLVINHNGVVYAGHRRRVASRVAYNKTGDPKFLTVPVTYSDKPFEDALELMIHENMQRADMTPLEEARALGRLKERKNLSTADLIRRVNLAPNVVSAYLAILKLEPEVQVLYDAEELPLSIAALLTRVGSREKQISWAGLVARRQINVTEFRKQVVPDLAELGPDSPPTVGEGVEAVQPELRAPYRAKRAGYVKPQKKNGKAQKPTPTSGVREHPTRAEAVAALDRNLGTKVSLFNVKLVLGTVCCSCGMAEQSEVCRACPLPRLILGLVGRADARPTSPRRNGNGHDEDDE